MRRLTFWYTFLPTFMLMCWCERTANISSRQLPFDGLPSKDPLSNLVSKDEPMSGDGGFSWAWPGAAAGLVLLTIATLLAALRWRQSKRASRSHLHNRRTPHDDNAIILLLCWMCDAFRPARDRWLYKQADFMWPFGEGQLKELKSKHFGANTQNENFVKIYIKKKKVQHCS